MVTGKYIVSGSSQWLPDMLGYFCQLLPHITVVGEQLLASILFANLFLLYCLVVVADFVLFVIVVCFIFLFL